jgi:predicted ATP-grasp superfamily ATP-dependent carboligase
MASANPKESRMTKPASTDTVRGPMIPVVMFRSENLASLAIARSLGRMGVAVHAVDCDPDALAWKSRYCTQAVRTEAVRQADEATVRWLCEFAERFDDRPVLLATFDTRNLLVDAHRETLSRHYRLPQPRAGAVASLYDKREMYELCLRHAIPTPRTLFPITVDEAVEQAQALGYPLVLKGIDADRLQAHCARRMALVEDAQALRALWPVFDEPGVANLALQEFLPGDSRSTWAVTTYFDRQQQCRFSLTGHKVREWPLDGGVSTCSVTARRDLLVDAVTRLARAVGFHGAMDADFRFNPRDSSYQLLDVNPRVGANFRAWADADGHDVVRTMYLDLAQRPIPPVRPAWGRVWLNEMQDIWAARALWRSGSLSLAQWVRSWVGAREYALLALDDPRPGLEIPRSLLRRAAVRLRRAQPASASPQR